MFKQKELLKTYIFWNCKNTSKDASVKVFFAISDLEVLGFLKTIQCPTNLKSDFNVSISPCSNSFKNSRNPV